ncbi:membrane protein [Methylopila jiangsuensis]|uniref:Membrane protein n=1 Tax=Methylopila jiangsuensis TaxID=586230 RepID=A0A9W6JID3_9HYPH|nr:TIM44-like domain-containing protein [Methylopila jiangsuensis]MDR6284174.1 putative lipid-binding transport protein (Tim44 family) [Methylopila jiangsuensis]GLK76309.1 membrane protein [Methylopila jiangsuensis]
MSRPTLARRFAATALAALVAGVTLAPLDADARAGRSGGFGSRGSKTFSSPPPTATSPGAAPIQRSQTQPGAVQPGAQGMGAAAQQRRPGMFGGGFGGMLMGGLLGAGLFGLLSGSGLFGGLGSLASILGLVLQLVLIFFVVRFAMNWFRNRKAQQSPAYQSGPVRRDAGPQPGDRRFDAPPPGGGAGGSGFGGFGGFGGRAAAAQAVTPIQLDGGDFDAFERLLSDVQYAYSEQDLGKLSRLATSEMVDVFRDDLDQDRERGVVNRVRDVKLLQGDLSEAWREDARDYATVAMRYGLVDVVEDRATGRLVDGDPNRPVEATELWTFVRPRGGAWTLSAIQQAA